MLLPTGSVTGLLMFPVPAAILPVAPPVAVEVNVARVMFAESVSETVAVAASGPVLFTTIVYVTFEPAATVPTGPVLVIDKSEASRRRSSRASKNSRLWNRDPRRRAAFDNLRGEENSALTWR